MRFSTVFRATAVLLIMLIAASNIVDLLGEPHNYVLDPPDLDTDRIPGIDTDGDGLKDIHEDVNLDGRLSAGERFPTNPYDPDSDGDSLDDGDESELFMERAYNSSASPNWVLRFYTEQKTYETAMSLLNPLGDIDRDGRVNILDPDSDGDGLLDGEEVAIGLDPLDPDSDGDTIPDDIDEHEGFSVDEDSDGIDDQWEEWYGITDPADDQDADGLTNLQEFIRRTDPTRADSRPGHFGAYSINGLLGRTDHFDLVMETEGGGPRYHKVATFSHFDGRNWDRDLNPSPPVQPGSGNFTGIRYNLSGYWWGDLPHTSWMRDLDLLRTFPTFPGSNVSVDMSTMDPYVDVPALQYVESLENPGFDPEELSRANSTASVSSRYYQVPASIPQDIWDLARAWAGESESRRPFVLAQHMASSIFSRCQYSYESNFLSSTEDPVYRFFMLTRKGSALDYASAFTIVMRMSGVPARLVMGYALGTDDGESRIFLKGHLHAWSEVYIEGYGWIPFEVTEHSMEPLGGTGVRASGKDPFVYGPYGGDGGGTLVGNVGGDLDPNGDEDNDNLTNSEEAFWETSPTDPDDDGDGLLDGREVKFYGTHPKDPDTDNDTLTDGEEVNIYGTDPTSWDTDHGNVSDGTEVYLDPPLDPLDPSDDYQYSDVDGDGIFNDNEKAFGTSPLNPDSDGDNLTDGAEVQSYRTDPTDPDTDGDGLDDDREILGLVGSMFSDPNSNDTDGDGLSDLEETIMGTHPGIFDTDNDGRGDGAEVLTVPTTDPLDPDTDDDGIMDGRELELLISPVLPDTDGDLRPDGMELWSGTKPGVPDDPLFQRDMDGDGLSDSLELNIGTSVSRNDTDDDGLLDGFEYSLGLSPVNNDTDGDGIDDHTEIFELFTSPMLNDTDGDGLLDLLETEIGTSPRIQDTDR
ncbi:MAG: transglutaminase domain-containing protein, partial [Thermoplasmatota archaeon]